MAAGQQYNKHLNLDQAYVKTPAVLDASLDEWVMLTRNTGSSRTTATLQNTATANGNGTSMDVSALATAMLEVRGTFSATVNFEGSLDDTNWYPLLTNQRGTGVIASTTTATGLYEVNVSAIKSVRARISGYVSGSVTVVGSGTAHVAPNKAMILTGSKATQLSPGLSLPISVAAGEHKTVATGTNLTANGYKRVTFGYKLDVAFSHQAYLNFYDSGSGFFANKLTGISTGSSDVKESIIYTQKMMLIINNQDTVAHNVTSLDIWLWPN